jgi:hypothetical protein
MLNLSALFFSSNDEKAALLDNLELSAGQKANLESARKEIRTCLKVGIPEYLTRKGFPEKVPEPRFYTQGSWAYKTLNAPGQFPQQADLDDGAYLPISFVSQTARPSQATGIFFEAAEEVLRPLAKTRGWDLIVDKPTCVRIQISNDAHIDVPLYAIPDTEFEELAKAALENYNFDSVAEAVKKADKWTELDRDKVLLAHRTENWRSSDPRPLRDWFVEEVAAKGPQLRRVVRYLKAFRDWQWAEGGPSSILLMAAATPLFGFRDGRDDLALLDVVVKMPKALRDGVVNPTNSDESLTDRLGTKNVEEAAKAFENLESFLRAAIDASSAEVACKWMIEKFGMRFPDQPSWVKVVSVAATIAAAPAVAGPSEIVGRTKAA